jgi:hypothetical protein
MIWDVEVAVFVEVVPVVVVAVAAAEEKETAVPQTVVVDHLQLLVVLLLLLVFLLRSFELRLVFLLLQSLDHPSFHQDHQNFEMVLLFLLPLTLALPLPAEEEVEEADAFEMDSPSCQHTLRAVVEEVVRRNVLLLLALPSFDLVSLLLLFHPSYLVPVNDVPLLSSLLPLTFYLDLVAVGVVRVHQHQHHEEEFLNP